MVLQTILEIHEVENAKIANFAIYLLRSLNNEIKSILSPKLAAILPTHTAVKTTSTLSIIFGFSSKLFYQLPTNRFKKFCSRVCARLNFIQFPSVFMGTQHDLGMVVIIITNKENAEFWKKLLDFK